MPEIAGVYVIYFRNDFDDKNELMYIGRSTNFKKRFSCHRIYSKLLQQEIPFQRWLIVKIKPTENHKELEKALIQKLKPPMNKFFNWGR